MNPPQRRWCRTNPPSKGAPRRRPTAGAEADLDGTLCPWCIADGSAAERFEALFTEAEGDVTREQLFAITQRTPGFTAWQVPQWQTHCGDGAAFLGLADAVELGGDASTCLFQCRICGTRLSYSDAA